MKLKLIQIFFFLLFSLTSTFAQGIKINEVSSSNANVIKDNDGDSPDWIELFNNSSAPINLSNYFISDDINNLTKWNFPSIELEPDSLLLFFASGKDITKTVDHWETVIREGDSCKYLIPSSTPSNDWKLVGYSDSTWSTGKTGIGFGDDDDSTIIAETVTAYLRCKFTVDDINQISGLFFNIDFDDGFVAYLNGEEIARENLGLANSQVFYNTEATAYHEAQMYQGLPPNAYPITDKIDLLQNGDNVLAIEVHNSSINSTDLSIIPFLSIGYNNIPASSKGSLEFLNLKETKLHTNFKLSADGELLIVSNANGDIKDTLNTGQQVSDISIGRFPNGSENLFFFDSPTPGKKNVDNGFNNFLQSTIFSIERGFFDTAFFLDITNPNSTGTIRYSIDGSEPNENSTVYSNQLVISETSVIRAKIYAENSLPSKTETHTYFINQEQRLPIISLTTKPEHFFDADSGIYVLGNDAAIEQPYYGANFWEEWERPIHLEFFEENHEFGFEIDLGVKIFGQWSRAHAQKSLAFYARGEYGYSEINYKLFPNSEIKKYQSFVLRNSGTDWKHSMIRDGFMQEIVSPLDIDQQNYRPVVVYVNGEYWGIHNLREKINEHYIESHHNISKDDINLIQKNFEIIHGEKESFEQFYNSLEYMDMTTDEAFEHINSNIEINEFIDYCLAQIYYDNQDWPGNNIKYWQKRSTNSKWRWILFDTDFGFGIWIPDAYKRNTLTFALATDGPVWPNPPWSTFLLRKLLENQKFKNLFIGKYSTYSNTLFLPNRVNEIISIFSSRIEPELPFHYDKWQSLGGGTFTNWQNVINIMRTFANNRLPYLSLYFKSYFELSGEYKLTVNQNIEQGNVEITDFSITEDSWDGTFFDEIPLNVRAIPRPGFAFSNWTGDINSTDNPIVLTTFDDIAISPVFIPGSNTQVVINEINYNSNNLFNPEDWIELCNYADESIDISGWVFKDENFESNFVLPANTIIAANDYIVLCRDTTLFKAKFPNVVNYYGNFGFGLSGGGELISLYNNSGYLIDSLTYDNGEPWPLSADGGGPTLELKNPYIDNSKHYYWKESVEHGTPGETNSVFSSVNSKADLTPTEYKLLQNYPNPFNPTTNIQYSISSSGIVKLTIYDILGKEIIKLVDEYKKANFYNVEFNSTNLPSGIYFYTIISGKYSQTKKMVLLK
ncbi:MAG: T9SS type A sorting domain-containing protein [Ignavibacteriae bacterium]|nr:T9SS type A sorting domain-containing protein [Ignavibacteriota bacterium]